MRLEEETEAAQSAKAALQRLQNEYAQLKSKYDKEILVLTEELEDIRSVSLRATAVERLVLSIFNQSIYFVTDRHYSQNNVIKQNIHIMCDG